MEHIYTLDKKTAPVFQKLHPSAPEIWFGEDTVAWGVVEEHEAAALLLLSVSEETLCLNWLYVAEKFRGMGIGRRLLHKLAERLDGYGGDGQIHTVCTSDMKDYLESMGFFFEEEPEYATFRSAMDEAKDLLPYKESDRIRPVYTLSGTELNRIGDLLNNDPELSVGIGLPVDPAKYLKESAVYMGDDGIKAMVFLQQISGEICISYAYAATPADGGKLLQLLSNAKESIRDRYWEDITVNAAALNKKSEEMIKKLLPKAERTDIWKGSMVLI